MKEKKPAPGTDCVHAGSPEHEAGPVVNPVYLTSTFRFRDATHGAALFAGTESGFIYTRMLNPTVKELEDCVAALEGGAFGLATGSGMAAIHTTVAALCSSGDHVVCSEAVYGPTLSLLSDITARLGIKATAVDTTDPAKVAAAFTPATRVLLVETPGNPTLCISDLAALSRLCREKKAALVVDNTFMTPVLQQPLGLGADIVVHSLTKFLNGHADVVGGIIVVKDKQTYDRFRRVLNHLGGVLAPFEAFLVRRGIRTLHLRMQRHCENAARVAGFLEAHPKVAWVRFPGLPSHPQFALAQ
ncbi:MAG: aminotransferase class I/II-fold pyridoxal phosphate-dependent enzyme, partial [candidate division WOR-3 bacterium]